MSDQPEALRLADAIDPLKRYRLDNLTCAAAAACLRRLHAEIESAQQAQRDAENELSRTMALHVALHDLRMLRNAVDAMMAVIGYHGTIRLMDGRVQRVMDAMAASDWAAAFEADEEEDEQP